MKFLGKLLSCFVAERKHRTTKRCALFVFRCIDNVVVKDMLSRQCEQIRSGAESLFAQVYLVRPKTYNFAGTMLHRATGAVLPCGAVRAGDLVWLSTDVVAQVTSFWKADCADHTSVQVETYVCLDGRATRWQPNSCTIFVDSADVVSTLIYSRSDRYTVTLIPPATAYL